MADSKVSIVFAADFGEALRSLDLSFPVWIVQSGQNDLVIAELRKAKMARGITSFRPQEFGQLVDTVDQHHPGWTELDVFGLQAEDAKQALLEYGQGHFNPTPSGFAFRRTP